MLTPREFAGLIDHGHIHVRPHTMSMEIYWNFQIIGMNIQAKQKFTTDPCEFELSAFNDNGEERWTVTASFERARNTPHTLFGQYLDDPECVGLFAVIWNTRNLPTLQSGDGEQFTTDLLLLRMAGDLWSI